MKFEWNKKRSQIMICACLLILFAVVCVFFFIKVDVGNSFKSIMAVFNPIFYGIIIAYVVNRIVKIFENRVFSFLDKKEKKMKLKRTLSVSCAYITVIIILALLCIFIGPQVWAGIVDLKNNVPMYIAAVQNWLTKLSEQSESFSGIIEKLVSYINSFIDKVYDIIEYIMPKLTGILGNIFVFIKDFIVGIILSVYFLLQKEKFIAQGKRFVRALFSENKYEKIVRIVKQADDSFGGYIVAMAFDSLLVGLECFVICSIVGIPYYPLVSLIIGFTNFIPFFGPFIGAIPSAFIIFIADPISVIWFIIIIVVIQQIDGNIIAPKIIGNHLNLSSVWVVIAISIMSGLFGFMGMVIGVPVFSLIYTWFDDAISNRLRKKGLATEIVDYYSDSVGKEIELERIKAEENKEKKPSLFTRIKSMFVTTTEQDIESEPHEDELAEDYLDKIDYEDETEKEDERVLSEKDKK